VTATGTVAGPSSVPAALPTMARWLPFEWIVAIRFLREGRVQTAFIIGGVAIGVAVIVFMSALMSGLQENLVRRTLTGQSHIQLLPPKEISRPLRAGEPGGAVEGSIVQVPLQRVKGLDQWQMIVTQVRRLAEVRAVAAVAVGSTLIERGEVTRAISVVGMEPDDYFRIVPMAEKLVRGVARATTNDILIGTELASDLGVVVGDKLRLVGLGGTTATLTVSGIFDLGNKPANARTTYVALRTAQSLLDLPGGVSEVDVTVADVYAAEQLAQRISALTGVRADSWIRTNDQLFTAVRAQGASSDSIRLFVALSVAFGIASVLVVSVVQKSREIGILRAMGITRGQVLRLFLLQGGLLGLGGAVAGSALGAACLMAWQRFVRNADGTAMFPLAFTPALFLWALLLAMATGTIAAVAPALRAAHLDPEQAIRG
jgi:lipoprotein-releasing system permease protein